MQWQDSEYGQRNKVYKGLLFRNGAIFVVVTHICQAFEDICRERKSIELHLGVGQSGSKARDVGVV